MKFFRDHWLYLLVAFLPFERIPSWDVTILGHSVTLRLSYLVALAALAFFTPYLVKTFRFSLRDPRMWLLGYLFIVGLSVLAALDMKKALLSAVPTAITIFTAILVARYAHHFDREKLYRVLLGVTVLVCLFGLYQFIGDSLGLSTAWTGLRLTYTKAVFGFPRIQATSLEPLYLGNFLLIPLFLLVGRLYTGKAKREEYAALFLIVLTFVLTLSRGAFGAALVGLPLLAIVLIRQTRWTRIAAIGGATSLAIATAFLMINIFAVKAPATTAGTTTEAPPASNAFVEQSTNVTSGAGRPDSDREENRQLAEQAINSRPLLGYGIGNFGTFAQNNDPNYSATKGKVTVNNEYLEILSETGIVGAAMLLAFLGALAVAVVTAWKAANPEDRMWIVALACIVIGFLVQYYAFSTLYIMHIWVTVGLLLACTAYARGSGKKIAADAKASR